LIAHLDAIEGEPVGSGLDRERTKIRLAVLDHRLAGAADVDLPGRGRAPGRGRRPWARRHEGAEGFIARLETLRLARDHERERHGAAVLGRLVQGARELARERAHLDVPLRELVPLPLIPRFEGRDQVERTRQGNSLPLRGGLPRQAIAFGFDLRTPQRVEIAVDVDGSRKSAHVVPGSVAVAAPDVDAMELELRKMEREGRLRFLLRSLSRRLLALVHRDARAVHLRGLDLDLAEEKRQEPEAHDDFADAAVQGRLALTLGRHADGHSLDLHAEREALESGGHALPPDGRALALRSHLLRLGLDEVLRQEQPRGEVDDHDEPDDRSEDDPEDALRAGPGGGFGSVGHGSGLEAALVERSNRRYDALDLLLRDGREQRKRDHLVREALG